jgi:hypothetical protein
MPSPSPRHSRNAVATVDCSFALAFPLRFRSCLNHERSYPLQNEPYPIPIPSRFSPGLWSCGFAAALESFRPLMAATQGARAVGTTASGAPLRMAYLYIPNGVNVAKWRPNGTTGAYKMGATFASMEKHREDFQISPDSSKKTRSAERMDPATMPVAPRPFSPARARAKPQARTSNSAFQSTRWRQTPSKRKPACLPSNSPPMASENPANATPATPAPISSTSPGVPKTSR